MDNQNDNLEVSALDDAARAEERERQAEEFEAGQHEEAQPQVEPSATITAANLFKQPVNPLKPYCPKFAIPGALTILAGDPKAGKTTLLLHLLSAVTNGEKFLGEQCLKTNALYASEQNSVVLREQLRNVPALESNSRLHFIPLEMNCEWELEGHGDEPHNYGHPLYRAKVFTEWREQVDFWRKQIVKTHAKILVVDTFVSFARLESGDSFDAGVMTGLFMELKTLFQTRNDLSIVVLHHLRKGDSNNPSPIRKFSDVAGSYALRAATDQNIVMFAHGGKEHPNRRRIILEGRFGANESLDAELNGATYNRIDAEPVVEKQGIAAVDRQADIAGALNDDPRLDLLANKPLAEKLKEWKITEHQIQVFRKKHPRGSIAESHKAGRNQGTPA